MVEFRTTLAIATLSAFAVLACADSPDPSRLAGRIDALVDARLDAVGVPATPQADDAEFLRRIHLDVRGRIPSPRDVYAFLDDPSPDKRATLVDELLETPRAYAHEARLWRAALAPETTTNPEARIFRVGFEAWLRDRIRDRTPYDEWARQLIAAPISADAEFPTPVLLRPEAPNPLAFYAVKEAKPENLAAASTRIFLGVQIECAQCHDHPFDRWSQDQFWNQAAFFGGLTREGDGLFAPLSERLEVRQIKLEAEDRFVSAAYLDETEPPADGDASPRDSFAGWIASDRNPYFARAAANRVWSRFFGRGLVEPIDDFREDNPPSHPELLDELARELVAAGYDLSHLARAILRTKAYSRTSSQSDPSQADPTLLAKSWPRALTGEQLFDSLVFAVGYDEADARRSPREGFLARFAANGSATAPETSIPQALALRNGDFVTNATSLSTGRTLAAACETPGLSLDDRVELLYVSTLSRRPDDRERERVVAFVEAALAHRPGDENAEEEGKRLAEPLGDVLWALLSSAEFRLNH